jgi:hypothetical protein
MLILIPLALALALVQAPELDSDGDGLSDFREVHKHRTDPRAADSDGDGVPDGAADERREWTYTVRTIVQIVPPLVTDDVLCDDWQDARVLDRTDEYVELEVVHYPLGTANEAIEADPHWRAHTAGLEGWLAPGPTSNWDAELRDALVAALAGEGIDASKLDDRALVERASRWLCEHARTEDGFTTFQCELVDGAVRPHPELRERAEREAQELGRTLDEQWQRELFAKGMFENAVRGSCTSSATYLNGCLRALGIPTRIVLAVPLVDATDERELGLLRHLRHPKVRRIVEASARERRSSWASHTFNEVWVGGRWRRLNYERLGQGILDPGLFGMITHVATLDDWLDDGMAARFGLRQAQRGPDGRRPDAFGFVNPYSTIALSDRFGVHSGLAPELVDDDELKVLTIERAYWWSDPSRHPIVSMRLDDPDTAGHVLVHVREHVPGRDRLQYGPFYERVSKRFELRAAGRPSVPLTATRGLWAVESEGVREFYLRIEPDDLPRMAIDVPYALVPLDGGGAPYPPGADADWGWKVAENGVTLTRRARADRPAEASAPAPESPAREGVRGGTGTETGEPLAELAIDSAAWSDAPDSPTGRLGGEMGTVLLLRVGDERDFPRHKRFTLECDRRFRLEAPGHPPIEVTCAVGGVTNASGSWLVVRAPADGWALAEGVGYRIVPVNGNATRQWTVADGIIVRR